MVFSKLDRLARSVFEFAKLMRVFRSRGWGLVCLDPEFDTDTAAGRLVAHVFAAIGEWEVENTVERLADAREAKRDAGGWASGPPPFAYRAEGRGRLGEDPDEQEVIARIIALRDGPPRRTWKQVAAKVPLSPGGGKNAYRRATGGSGGRIHTREVTP